MRKEQVNCDACGSDLTWSESIPKFRISMNCEPIQSSSDTIFSVFVRPPICREHNFCGLNCLQDWIEKLDRSLP